MVSLHFDWVLKTPLFMWVLPWSLLERKVCHIKFGSQIFQSISRFAMFPVCLLFSFFFFYLFSLSNAIPPCQFLYITVLLMTRLMNYMKSFCKNKLKSKRKLCHQHKLILSLLSRSFLRSFFRLRSTEANSVLTCM